MALTLILTRPLTRLQGLHAGQAAPKVSVVRGQLDTHTVRAKKATGETLSQSLLDTNPDLT